MKLTSKYNTDSNDLVSTWPDYKLQDVVCDCMAVRRKEIIPLIEKVSNVDDLVSCSGVGSVCTGCHPLLHEMMGEKVWTPVEITSIREVSSEAKTYRFKSLSEPFTSAESGQHILLQVYINGSWVIRRYTLTTPANETAYREITVQREADGLVSNWLFNLDEKPEANESVDFRKYNIRLSQPMGNIKFDLTKPSPLVCLVGGIGVTPALSAIRTVEHNSRQRNTSHQVSLCQQYHSDKKIRKVWIDYSAQNQERLVCADELNNYGKNNDNAHITIRVTDNDDFINQHHVNEIVASNPDGEFFVCGPSQYIDAVTDYLITAGVAEKNIKVELFSVPEAKELKQSKNYFYLGLFLLAAFLIQDAFQLKMQWLETLQTNNSYKIYSGLGLLLYLLMQFVLPYNKSCEMPHADADSYNRHKLRGIFTPLVFYFHSTQFGVAYLFLLSCVFFGNILIGLLNHELIAEPVKRVRYFKLWLPIHIVVSILLVSLIAFHIFVVTSY